MAQTLAVAYLRTSTNKQEASIEDQDKFARVVEAKERLKLLRVFQDAGVVGDEILRRDGLQQMFLFCEEQQRKGEPVEVLIVWDMDRFSRADSVKTAVIIDRLRESGVSRIYSPEGWFDLADELAMTMQHLKQDFSRRGYVKAISKNVSRSCRERAMKGQWIGGRRPYGYTIGEDKHLALDDPAKAETVAWLFHQYLARDTSQHELAKELERRGVPPPEYHSQRRKAAEDFQPKSGASPKWTAKNVGTILHNPIYTGTMYYARTSIGKYQKVTAGGNTTAKPLKTGTGGPKLLRNPAKDQIIVPNAHPPLVDESTFTLVRRKLESNKPGFVPGTTRKTFKWLFGNGLARCGHCGAPMYGRHARAQYKEKRYEWAQYLCSTYNYSGCTDCAYNCIREDELLKMVTGCIKEHFSDPKVIDLIKRGVRERSRLRQMDGDEKRLSLRRRIADLGKWVGDGYARLAKIPEDMLQKVIDEVRKWEMELEDAKKQLASLDRLAEAAASDQDKVEKTLLKLQRLPQVKGNTDALREMLRSIIDHIKLHWEPIKQVSAKSRGKRRRRQVFSHLTIQVTDSARLFGIADMAFTATGTTELHCSRYCGGASA